MFGLPHKLETSVVAIGIALAALALYARTFFFPFVYFDDDLYVFQNAVVSAGLSWKGAVWAFVSGYAANWHPLTWLSHMIDVQAFGMAAGGHHAINVAFHAVNSALLFLLLNRMTNAPGRSACVALLFAIHPTNVESVAWISERKNVLSTFVMLVTLIAYARYAGWPSFGRYAVVFLGMALGLMAKPMLVTLPFILLLLDYWPLNRLGKIPAIPRFGSLAYEKLPLFALSSASCAVTYWAQLRGQAMDATPEISFVARMATVATAYIGYLKNLVFPVHLSVIYPHPGEGFSRAAAVGAILLLCVLTTLAVAGVRRMPSAVTGWLWFVGALVPVIGFVQVGYQAMADRYLYVPAIGIFVAVVWGVSAAFERAHVRRSVAFGVTAAIVAVLVVLSWRQISFWRGTAPLFEHAIAATDSNAEAHNHLGYYYLMQDRPGAAIPHFEAAQRERPELAATYTNWGAALRMQGDAAGAVKMYAEALRLRPSDPVPLTNMGIALLQLGRAQEARMYLERAIESDPSSAAAHAYLGVALSGTGDSAAADKHLRKALELDPEQARAILDALGLSAYDECMLETGKLWQVTE